MSSIFDKMRAAMSRKGQSRSSGSSSGSQAHYARAASSDGDSSGNSSSSGVAGGGGSYQMYQVRLDEPSLGVQIEPTPGDGRPRIIGLIANAPAVRLGLVVGDILAAIEGNPIASSEDFVAAMQAVPRPVHITFFRYVHAGAGTISSSNSSNGGNRAGVVLSDVEKDKRREAMAAAALQRGKTWDKKVATAKSKRDESQVDLRGRPIYDHSALAELGASNAETQRMVALTKQSEAESIQKLGYDPFKPIMSSSSTTAGVGVLAGIAPPSPSAAFPLPGAARAPTISSPSSPSSGAASAAGAVMADTTADDLEEGEQYADIVDVVNAAMQQLLEKSVAEDGERVQTALCTVEKMLSSLRAAVTANNSEALVKMRSVRVMNSAFQSKVASVSGGTELMEAAGFELQDDASPGEQGGRELFLKHSLGHQELVKLRYTIARLKELL